MQTNRNLFIHFHKRTEIVKSLHSKKNRKSLSQENKRKRRNGNENGKPFVTRDWMGKIKMKQNNL